MNKISSLRHSALESAKWRGHGMKRFKRDSYWPDKFHSECRHCGAWLTINGRPAPNEIDISGSALAVECPKLI